MSGLDPNMWCPEILGGRLEFLRWLSGNSRGLYGRFSTSALVRRPLLFGGTIEFSSGGAAK
eukprot:552630-Prorocentrum_minimum.AAC.1